MHVNNYSGRSALMMGNARSRSSLSLKSFITLSVFFVITTLGCAERKDEIEVTLDDYASNLELFYQNTPIFVSQKVVVAP
jgi:hypothetical protein